MKSFRECVPENCSCKALLPFDPNSFPTIYTTFCITKEYFNIKWISYCTKNEAKIRSKLNTNWKYLLLFKDIVFCYPTFSIVFLNVLLYSYVLCLRKFVLLPPLFYFALENSKRNIYKYKWWLLFLQLFCYNTCSYSLLHQAYNNDFNLSTKKRSFAR